MESYDDLVHFINFDHVINDCCPKNQKFNCSYTTPNHACHELS